MDHREVIAREIEESSGLRRVVARLKRASRDRVVVFSHDDPDGTTSAAIVARALEGRVADLRVRFPPRFVLEQTDVRAVLDESPADLLIVVDKGTSGKIDAIADLAPDIVVIDHHPLVGEIRRAAWYNPCVELGRPSVSASMLCHFVANALGGTSPADDLDAAIGLKADWAIDPTYGNDGASDYVEPFMRELRARWPALFAITPGATLFDFAQRDKSSTLSKIAELFFAVTGGGGQYFYDHPALDGVDQTRLGWETSMALVGVDIANVGSVDDLIAASPAAEQLSACLDGYRRAWSDAHRRLDSTRFLFEERGVAVYLFETGELPLLPMVGSVVVGERVRAEGRENGVIVMASRQKDGSHFSLRSTGGEMNVGAICQSLEERLVARFGPSSEISGGGHIRAGECRTGSSGVPHEESLSELLRIIEEFRSRRPAVAAPARGVLR